MNSKDWYLQGKANNDIEAYKKAVVGDDLWYIDKLNALVAISRIELDAQHFGEALKYAVLASICTESPRADVCCLLGDIYFQKGNLKWAKLWFEQAVGNILLGSEAEGLDMKYCTTYPLASLSTIEYAMGNVKNAMEYNDTVLELDSENEVALNNKAFLKQGDNPTVRCEIYESLPSFENANNFYVGQIIALTNGEKYVATKDKQGLKWHKL